MKNLKDYYMDAIDELQALTLKQIQVETAYKWAGRALAAASLGKGHDAIEYAHEALEHAALSGKDSVLREVREAFKSAGVEP
jgi:hypothetical protein